MTDNDEKTTMIVQATGHLWSDGLVTDAEGRPVRWEKPNTSDTEALRDYLVGKAMEAHAASGADVSHGEAFIAAIRESMNVAAQTIAAERDSAASQVAAMRERLAEALVCGVFGDHGAPVEVARGIAATLADTAAAAEAWEREMQEQGAETARSIVHECLDRVAGPATGGECLRIERLAAERDALAKALAEVRDAYQASDGNDPRYPESRARLRRAIEAIPARFEV